MVPRVMVFKPMTNFANCTKRCLRSLFTAVRQVKTFRWPSFLLSQTNKLRCSREASVGFSSGNCISFLSAGRSKVL